jgi:hypothetical protein
MATASPREAARRERRARLGRFSLIVLFAANLAFLSYTVVNVQIARLDADADRPGVFEDYAALHAAGRLVLEGRGDELYAVESIRAEQRDAFDLAPDDRRVLPYMNPPFLAPVLAPIAALPIGQFSLVLAVLVALTVVAGGVAVERFLPLADRRQRLLFWLGYLSFFPGVWTVVQGQVSILPLLGWLGFVWCQQRGREGWSGAALALCLVKPQFALVPLALLLWKRRWQALKPFVAIAGVLVAASVLVAGPRVLLEYPRFLLDTTSWEHWGVSAAKMFGWNGLVATLTGDATPSFALVLPFTIATLAVVAWAWRGAWEAQSTRFLPRMSLAFTAALLINPHLNVQDLVLIVVPIALGAAWALRSRGGVGIWAAVAIAAWALALFGTRLQIGAGVNLITPSMALLVAYLAVLLRRERTNEAASGVETVRPRAA